MIIKEKDSRESDIALLESVLAQDLPQQKSDLVKKELASLRKGVKGEEDAAYLINFDFGSSKNWAVLHDLRLEVNGQVAQIDHLLINRFFEFYVLESKNFSYGMKIEEDGDFLVYYNKQYHGIPSPIEQNRRHIKVLEECLKMHDIMPKRLGIPIKPNFINYVLMSAGSRVIRPKKSAVDSSAVIKVDSLHSTIDKKIDNMQPLGALACVAKLSSSETVMDIAQRIAALHKPIQIDYAKRFGVASPQADAGETRKKRLPTRSTRYFCWACKEGVPDVVAEYCWSYKHIYDNKVYCKKCQKRVLEKRNAKVKGQ
ncbi:MAG: NERD domain-containing protein [Desulfobulbaceae bacterium]|nr:NERD domain-containing protein [Desulfobulbaceae bacterium]